jgi:hypothetical protein
MRTKIVLLAVLALLMQTAHAASPSVEGLPPGRDFGAGLSLGKTTPLATVLAAPERYAADPVLVRGRLSDLCTKKGCWTVLADGASHVRVRFHDYGFFLPPDALGAEALVEGVADIRTLSEREARHIAAESSGGDPDAVAGPQREVGFVATGVRLLPAGSADAP